MYYKTIVVVCAFITLTKSFDISLAGAKAASKACGKELQIKTGTKSLKSTRSDQKSKCLRHCTALKLNLFTESGEPILDKFPNASLPYISDFAHDCANQLTETEKCARVNMISLCIRDKYAQLKQRYLDECASETGVKMDNVMDISKILINVHNTKYHCYFHCLLVKSTVMDNDGNIHVQKFMPLLAGSQYEDIDDHAESCSKENNQKDVCAKSALSTACIVKKYYLGKFFG